MGEVTDWGTVGWFSFASGTVGITKGQTLRVSVVNLDPGNSAVLAGIWQNPRPVPLIQGSFALEPGESRGVDLKADSVPEELFDEMGRVQVRVVVRSSTPAVRPNLEVFDEQTGRTSLVLPLEKWGRS